MAARWWSGSARAPRRSPTRWAAPPTAPTAKAPPNRPRLPRALASPAPKPPELPASLDQRLSRFQEALDSRTQTLNDALSARVMDIARTLAEGGKEVVAALDKRISDVSGTINT